MKSLVIGNQYSKADFGIGGIVRMWSEITVEGNLFAFFNENSRYKNDIQEDDFVYECRGAYGLIPYGEKSELQRHVFFHYAKNKLSKYTYLGKGLYEKRYDDKRNKIFFKEEK